MHKKGDISVVSLSYNKRYIALGGERRKFEIWDNKTKKLIKAL